MEKVQLAQLLKAPSRGVPDGTMLAKAAPGRGSERIKALIEKE